MADQKISQLAELTVPPDLTDELVVVDKSDTTMAASGTNKRIQFGNLFDWAEVGDLSTIEPDDAAAAGTSTEIARADHKHAIGAASASALSGTNAEGSSTSFARADHNHAFGAMTPLMGVMPIGAPVGTATGGANTWYTSRVILWDTTVAITGIEFKNGTTMNGNVRAALYNYLGTKVAERTSDLAQAGTANTRRQVAFDSTFTPAVAGLFYALIWFSSATAEAIMAPGVTPSGAAGKGTNATTVPTSVSTSNMWNTAIPIMWPY